MQSKVSARGQIAIPAKIRKTHNLKKDVRVEWIDEGSHILLIPLPEDPVAALKGAYRGLLSTEDLLKERAWERAKELGTAKETPA